ncbi:hypothetical protein L9F63_002723, partial [Diploptera punctata]
LKTRCHYESFLANVSLFLPYIARKGGDSVVGIYNENRVFPGVKSEDIYGSCDLLKNVLTIYRMIPESFFTFLFHGPCSSFFADFFLKLFSRIELLFVNEMHKCESLHLLLLVL